MPEFQTLRLIGVRKESLISLAFSYVPMGCPDVKIGIDNLDRVPAHILCPLSQGIEFNDTNSN